MPRYMSKRAKANSALVVNDAVEAPQAIAP